MNNRDNKFDLDLKYGQEIENQLAKILQEKGTKIEVKTERNIWQTTNKLAIEFRCNGKPSGLSVTESDWWAIALADKETIGGIILIPTQQLKENIKILHKAKLIKITKGGDGDKSEMFLVPIHMIPALCCPPTSERTNETPTNQP
jgi:hypothetical protein